MSTKDLARGKWRSILSSFIDDFYLDGNHHSCPLCGGEDRFRFDDKDGSGSYYCNQCGAGTSIHLLSEFLHISYAEAWRKVEAVAGKAVASTPKGEVDYVGRIKRILSTVKPIAHGDEVWRYLQSRGIKNPASNLGIGKIGELTTMVGRFAKGNKLAGLHVTFLKDGKKVEGKNRQMFGIDQHALAGAAVRLHTLNGTSRLLIAEGVETALSAHQLWGVPCWAAGSATMLAKIEVPDFVTEVIVAGDNDSSFTGQAAAYTLAQRLRRDKKSVIVRLPENADKDWNEIIQAK